MIKPILKQRVYSESHWNSWCTYFVLKLHSIKNISCGSGYIFYWMQFRYKICTPHVCEMRTVSILLTIEFHRFSENALSFNISPFPTPMATGWLVSGVRHIIFAWSRASQKHHVFHNPNPNRRVHQSPKVGSKPLISPILNNANFYWCPISL